MSCRQNFRNFTWIVRGFYWFLLCCTILMFLCLTDSNKALDRQVISTGLIFSMVQKQLIIWWIWKLAVLILKLLLKWAYSFDFVIIGTMSMFEVFIQSAFPCILLFTAFKGTSIELYIIVILLMLSQMWFSQESFFT